jgi:hypothetical protein
MVDLCPSWPCLAMLIALPLPFVVVPLYGVADIVPALQCQPSQGLYIELDGPAPAAA